MSIVATICARGGSVGLPGKNIKDFCGKPLIVHSIEQALACPSIDHVFVSTDDAKIAEIAANAGAQVPFIRPASLSTAEIGKMPVLQHCVDQVLKLGVSPSKIIDLQPTSPLRSLIDIECSLNLLSEAVDVVFSVCEADKNPYFTLVELDGNGTPQLSKKHDKEILSRQEAPKVYALNGAVYVWHTHTLSKGLWEGRSAFHVMPKERSIDIDDHIDFMLAEILWEERIN